MRYSAEVKTLQTADTNVLTDNIYLRGCSIHCSFCHNKSLWERGEFNHSLLSLINELSACKHVAIMGGEPTEINYVDMLYLIGYLKGKRRKVILFTSSIETAKYPVDYYHIDLKTWMFYPSLPRGENISYGLVCYDGISFVDVDRIASLIEDRDIYLKTPFGTDNFDTLRKVLEVMQKYGCTKIHVNERVKIK